MKRLALALMAFGFLSSPAEAARLFHASGVAKTSEKGVTVWRGKATEKPAPALKTDTVCERTSIVINRVGYPPRRMTTRGFWSGENYAAAYLTTTQGFYADRMRAGD